MSLNTILITPNHIIPADNNFEVNSLYVATQLQAPVFGGVYVLTADETVTVGNPITNWIVMPAGDGGWENPTGAMGPTGASNIFTASLAGKYEISVNTYSSNTSDATTGTYVRIVNSSSTNDVVLQGCLNAANGSTDRMVCSGATILNLAANTTIVIDLIATGNDAVSTFYKNAAGTTDYACILSIRYLGL